MFSVIRVYTYIRLSPSQYGCSWWRDLWKFTEQIEGNRPGGVESVIFYRGIPIAAILYE